MNIINVLMSFFDLVPVGLFLVGNIIYQRCFYNKMSKGAFALFATGGITVFISGLLKAIHKILYYLNICDFIALKECFFPMQTVGFVLLGISMIAVLSHNQGDHKAYSILPISLLGLVLYDASNNANVPAEFNGTMIFVVLMCLGVLILDASLILIATRLNKGKVLTIILIIIAFIFTLGMGYLSSKDMSDWIKEIVNTVAQGSFFLSALMFKKNGLEDVNYKVSIK